MKTSYEYLVSVIDSCYRAWKEGKWTLVDANQKAKQQIKLCGWTASEYALYPFRNHETLTRNF